MINIKNYKIGTIKRNVQTSNGMLYKGTKVRILETYEAVITVSDAAGRLFYLNQSDILVN